MGKTYKDGHVPGTREVAARTELAESHVRYVRAAVLAVLSVTNDSTAWVDTYQLMADFTGTLGREPTIEEKQAESRRCDHIIDTLRRINEANMTERALAAVRPVPQLMLENQNIQLEEATITVVTAASGAVPRIAPTAQRTNHTKSRAPRAE